MQNSYRKLKRAHCAALLQVRPRVNVVVVDWSKIAGHEFYPIPAVMTSVLGRRVARQIERWTKAGAMSLRGVRLVGNSLGAHCAAFTAKAIKKGRVPFLVGETEKSTFAILKHALPV